ncbi:hypothetical protein MKI84_12945 [Ancylobacter sp. A5.8]|uniref:hypothetical protein n=1 Tax=Ancylobacter gelatini TaxID=2919920 RepID=UPI001F4DEC3D|nr:hypothetical protein [Ancylobacter gelatini]MCJ8143824.1 hypothetical protein [Ancylobacter gelatini]
MAERADGEKNPQATLPGVEPLRLRAPGRPAGAEGRSKKQLREYLAGLGYSDPAVVLAETMSMADADLQHVLSQRVKEPDGSVRTERVTLAEARAIRLRAAAELMPYLHGKMPTVELQPDEKLPMLILELGTNQLDIDRGRIDGGQRAGALSVGLPLLENQGLSGGDAEASHGATVSQAGESEEAQGFAGDDGDD